MLTLGLLLISCVALYQQWFLRADFYLFDRQQQVLLTSKPADQQIVIIAIDDVSLEQMMQVAGRWVWPRSVHAELIEGLQAFAPQAIAFDILFSEKDIYRPDADSYLNEVLSDYTNVFFSMLVLSSTHIESAAPLLTNWQDLSKGKLHSQAQSSLLLPFAIEPEYWRLGSINYRAELDGVGRYYDIYQQTSDWKIPSLATVLALNHLTELPKQSRVLLNWRGAQQQPYQTYSYVDIYRAVVEQNSDILQQFSGKTVLIGATAAGLYDARTTPINHNLPGVYMLATALDNIKHQDYYRQMSWQAQMILASLLIMLIGLCFYFFEHYSHQLFSLLMIISGSWLAGGYFSIHLLQKNQAFFIASPLLIITLSGVLFAFVFGYVEFLQRRQALSMFGRFLDPKVVLNLLSEGKLDAGFLNQKTSLTILFSDIRGFTQLSEQHSANQVLKLLNDYFSSQVEVIFSTNGTLDKFIGDCIMAFWGAPIASTTQATDAISAALMMQDNLLAFKRNLPEHLQDFDIGIGIHSGEAIAGLIGTAQRVDYTVIGDAVNLASRIEGLTKGQCRILVSEQTMLLAQQAYDFEEVGEFKVKGRQAGVKLYQPTRR
ncbi:adenylate/guanylate cyclase domain-containing protein [Thalassotalea insulae]|uniref:Adenylate/guanylate cyclase domain-containing protein n=2 Tax=Thalassotalea insulae TaxID=2056778 RepID=A0ABQ6GYS7_9GAMM|nr:adenylate/guanylate cyclase domain-containing protein [Thalassotalea insulae]